MQAVLVDDVGRMHCVSQRYASLASCIQEQRKQSFLTLAKENQSPLGSYGNPPNFFFTNPRFFLLLIRDRRLVLFCSLSALITNHATPTSYVIRRNDFRVP